VGNGATGHRRIEYRLTHRRRLPSIGEELLIVLSGTVARHEYDFSRAVEGGETIIEGNDIDTAPRNVHSVSVMYPDGGARRRWQAGATWSYVGSYFLDAANTARYPGHDTVDVRLSWSTGRDVSFTLRIDNLFDTAHADRADFAFGNYRYFPARGRAAFLAIQYQRD
jgi:outer membrane receptor protein involved in Fe transport